MSKTVLYFPALEPHKNFHHLPISLLAVAAPMVAQGEDVTLFDERVNDALDLEGVDRLMISAYTGYQISRAYQVSRVVKQNRPNIKVTLGGPHVTALPEQTLASSLVDEVIPGEVDDGQYPLPYHLVDVTKYVNPATKRFMYVTSYGCPGRCTFCATRDHRHFRMLPNQRIQADFENLMSRYPFKECLLFDATAFASQRRVLFLSDLMKHYRLKWIADARAPEIARASDAFLEQCVERGLQRLTIGLESGSPRIVEMMQKGHNHLEYFRQTAEKLSRLPVQMVSGVVFGCPGETVDDLRLTLDYIKAIAEINPRFQISTTFFRPLPNTVMTDEAKKYGYTEPQSLEEWAELGERNHYEYNHWQDSPWIVRPEEYRKVYEDFKAQNKGLFV